MVNLRNSIIGLFYFHNDSMKFRDILRFPRQHMTTVCAKNMSFTDELKNFQETLFLKNLFLDNHSNSNANFTK